MDKETRRKRISGIFIALTVVCYIGCLVLALVAYDDAQILDSVDRVSISTLSDLGIQDVSCFMSDCDNNASVNVGLKIEARRERNANLKIKNTANYIVMTSTSANYEHYDVYHTDKYLVMYPQTDGSFKIVQEKDRYITEEKKYINDTYETSFTGYFCDSHKDEASAILKREVKFALLRKPLFVLGIAFFPFNLVAVLALLIVPACIKYMNTKDRLENAELLDLKIGTVYTSEHMATFRAAIRRCKGDIVAALIFTCVGSIAILIGCFLARERYAQALWIIWGSICFLPFIMVPDRIIMIRKFKEWARKCM